jgi:hypothetical protein
MPAPFCGARALSSKSPETGLCSRLCRATRDLSVEVYAQANEASVHHLCSRDGDHEVDLIIERRDQRVVALEVMLGGVPGSADVRHLVWLREQLGDDLLDAAVITTRARAYRQPDGITVFQPLCSGPEYGCGAHFRRTALGRRRLPMTRSWRVRVRPWSCAIVHRVADLPLLFAGFR